MKTETYEQAISGQYTNYKGSQYASNLRCTLLDDFKGITPVLSYVHFHPCGYLFADQAGTVYDGGIYNL